MKTTAVLLVSIFLIAASLAIAGSKYEYSDDRRKKTSEEEMRSWQARIGDRLYVKADRYLEFKDSPGYPSRTFTLKEDDECQIIGLIMPKKNNISVSDQASSYYKLQFASGKIAYITVWDFNMHNGKIRGYDQIRLQEDSKQPTPAEREKIIAENNQLKIKKTSGSSHNLKENTSQGLSVEQKSVCDWYKKEGINCKEIKKVRFSKAKSRFIAVGCDGNGTGCIRDGYLYMTQKINACTVHLKQITYDELWTDIDGSSKSEYYWNGGVFQYRDHIDPSFPGFTIKDGGHTVSFKEESGFGREWFNCQFRR